MDQATAHALFDELTKIAKTSAEDKSRQGATATLLGTGGTLVGIGGGHAASQGALRAAEQEAAMEGGEALLGKLREASPVPIKEDPRAGMGAYVSDKASRLMGEADEAKIILPPGKKSPAGILGHEMGHAQFDKSRLGRLSQGIPARLAFNLSSLGSPAAGLAAGYGIDDQATGLGVAAGVPLAIAAPTLLSEGVASVKGLRNLRRAGASPGQLAAARKTLLRAFGTYGGKAGMDTGLGVTGYGAGRALRGAADQLEEEE